MIDPIRNPAYHDYQNKKLSQKVGANTEKGKFNLDYADEGVLYEPSSKEEEKTDQAEKKQADSFQVAAALELRELTETDPASAKKQTAAGVSFADTLRAFFDRAKQVLRQLWTTIWESRPTDGNAVLTKEELNDALSENGNAKDAAELTDMDIAGAKSNAAAADNISAAYGMGAAAADRPADGSAPGQDTGTRDPLHAANDTRILHALKSGDQKNFRSLLSEDGRRTPARNSSLLTYYDARGNLISPDASVQQRVLHGDRGSMKR